MQVWGKKWARKETNSRAKGADSNNNYNDELKWAQLGFAFIDAPRAKKNQAGTERNRSTHPKVTYYVTSMYVWNIRHSHRVSLNNSAHELVPWERASERDTDTDTDTQQQRLLGGRKKLSIG